MPTIPTTRGAARRRSLRDGAVPFALVCFVLVWSVAPAAAQEAPAGIWPGSPAVLAGSGEQILLRANPGWDAAVLAPLGPGTAVEVIAGPLAAGDGSSWFQVGAGQVGFVPAWSLAPVESAVEPAAPAAPEAPAEAVPAEAASWEGPVVGAQPAVGGMTTTSDVNLRSGPSGDAGVLNVLPPGTPVEVTGAASGGYTPVVAGGTAGWVATEYVGGSADAPTEPSLTAPSAAELAAPGGGATTTDLVNLRAGPSYNDAILAEVPPGAVVEATGALQGGFFPVTYNGQEGWIASEFLAFDPNAVPAATATGESEAGTADAPELSVPAAGGSGLIWPFSGGTWEVIQGYNNGTHTNRSSFANYQYSLDLARTDGNTAGQPVVAPASGTVQWVDAGSGGILIDMGNGYGVAMFHLTIDSGLGSGDPVEQGQYIGTVSGPGGPGYASTPHIDLTLWQLPGGGTHVSTPFTGQFAIAGREFPASGGANEHMGAEISA